MQVALDKPVKLDLNEVPIGQVFQKLTQASGVQFVIDHEAYDLLPYGDQTRLVVNIPNITLRNALSQMLLPLGMEWVIEKNAVRIMPTAPLVRLTRRATYEELAALGNILTKKVLPIEQGGAVLDQLRAKTGQKDMDLTFRTRPEKGQKELAFINANRALPCTGAQWLDMFCQGRGWTWYVSGDDIVIIEKKDQIERQLQRKVTLKVRGANLTDIMLDLAHQARVLLDMDPGVMTYVPADTREKFTLLVTDATIAQAFEAISGNTGLNFVLEDNGLRVEASEQLKKAYEAANGGTTTRRSPFFIKRSIALSDGTTVEVYFRAEDVPAGLQEAIEAEKAKLIKEMCKKYNVPATQPATQPAE